MTPVQKFEQYLGNDDISIHPVVDFDPETDQIYPFDLTSNNKELNPDILGDTDIFSKWISLTLADHNSRYGVGGYNEHRTIYSRSTHFDGDAEPRRLHLGVDIWGIAGTPVYNFHDAVVHSFHFNDHFGDYGSTIILKYQIKDLVFHALYGHLNLASLEGLTAGKFVPAGTHFADFGRAEENGYWPPHLHFQLILDMEGMTGDYPGVCRYSERNRYLSNCPDPNLILKHTFKSY
jgi:murein DD-endopeptidase MepM/ murein hydrolase activator NlpD